MVSGLITVTSLAAPGDFRIVTSGGVYGLESGGGKGGGTGTAITDTGWNYYMDGDGFTKQASHR